VTKLLKPYLQPYAGLLPPRVLEPGKPIATVTPEISKVTGLPKDCIVCAGTSGEWSPNLDPVLYKSSSALEA